MKKKVFGDGSGEYVMVILIVELEGEFPSEVATGIIKKNWKRKGFLHVKKIKRLQSERLHFTLNLS